MSKPLEITAAYQLVVPARLQDKIYEAVQEAIIAGLTPKDFTREVWKSWEIVLQEDKKDADEEFKNLLR